MIEFFYHCEILKCPIPITGYQCCDGWQDFSNLGISLIGAFHTNYGSQVFEVHQFDYFRKWIEDADRIIGFNSIAFDDRLCQANGIEIQTDYDLLKEIRIATWRSADYFDGKTSKNYDLEALGKANLARNRTGSKAIIPVLWQDGKKDIVRSYCLNNIELLIDLYKRRKALIDPTNGELIICRD